MLPLAMVVMSMTMRNINNRSGIVIVLQEAKYLLLMEIIISTSGHYYVYLCYPKNVDAMLPHFELRNASGYSL
jgi:hypothetical protein